MTMLPFQHHGGDRLAVAAAAGLDPGDVVDLSVSMNPFAPDVPTLAAGHLDALAHYPDTAAVSAATSALAEAIAVEPTQLVLTNGGAEAIAVVAARNGSGSVVEPEFSLYRRHLEAIVDAPERRWRSNPSNPLGELAAPDEHAEVWDEAFYPLATGSWSRGDDAWRLGSLTKVWSCPGLRLGYVVAPTTDDAEAVRRRLPQWSVNGLALALVEPLLARTDLGSWAAATDRLRDELATALRSLGFAVRPTAATWLLIDADATHGTDGGGETGAATQLRRRLASHGVLVRDCTSFGLPDVARVGLPRPEQLDSVVAAFAAVRR